MGIMRQRSGISQSMDLFIIIAAVLGVGGIVTGGLFSLVGAAATVASIQVVQVSAAGGTGTSATTIAAFSITVKNTGTSTFSSQTLMVTLGKSVEATGSNVPAPTCSTGSAGIAIVSSGNPVQLTCSGVTLAPGQQIALVESSTIGGTTALTTGWNVGTAYPVTVSFGSAATQVTVVA